MIVIVDYGMGNLLSVRKAFEFLGYKVEVSANPEIVSRAEKLVLPGVGAFGDAVKELDQRGLRDAILTFTKTNQPFLGICLGMQLLLNESEESPSAKGLGLIEGKNIKFSGDVFLGESRLKVPQIGWNAVSQKKDSPLFKNIPDAEYFYFVHSYHVVCDASVVAGETDYGYVFPSYIQKENLHAVQFHPEKSQRAGLEMLKNFAEL